MNIDGACLVGAILIGTGATLITDLAGLTLKTVFNVSPPNFCIVGRWFINMAHGVLAHENIVAAAARPGECVVGWIAHYIVGMTFALMLLGLVSCDWLANPTLAPAVALGLGTVLFPFLLMQPSFGLGFAASKAPNPTQARLKSLMTHLVFGTGLYVSAWPVSLVLRNSVL